MHGMKTVDAGFHGFGEAYFSVVDHLQIKGWKRHRRMVSNLIVPVGKVRLKIFDDRADSSSCGMDFDLTLGPDNYQRLTLPPRIWMAFQGLGAGVNLMLNVASIPHDPAEAESLPIDDPIFSGLRW